MNIHSFSNLSVVNHPLITHKLTLIRDEQTHHALFRQLLREIALLVGYEISRGLRTTLKTISTPITSMQAPVLEGPRPVIVPILRAGLTMADGLLELIPDAPLGHIGLYRDPETKRPVEYLVKLPPIRADQQVFMVDPMLATGHSMAYAVDVLNRYGVSDTQIRVMALVAAPEGVKVMLKAHPQVHIYTAALDEKLNDQAYIVPGLGDAGDRLFGTR